MTGHRTKPADATAPFRSDGTATVRVPLLPSDRVRDTWRLPPADAACDDQLTAYLRQFRADQAFREAVEVASPSLSRALDEAAAGRTGGRRLWRTAASLTRYRLRAAARTTPFGLFAAVGRAGFAPGAAGGSTLDLAAPSRGKHVLPDGAWLAAQLRELEADPVLQRRLRVVTNELVRPRGERLITPPVAGPDRATPARHTIRRTAVVRAVLDLAREPVTVDALVHRLQGAVPGAGEDRLRRLVADLIRLDILLSDLRPPPHAPDPLGHVHRRLTEVLPRQAEADRASGNPALRIAAARTAAARYRDQPVGQGLDALREANRRGGATAVLQVDTVLKGRLTLPRSVAEDLEEAAAVLWRLAPRDEQLSGYHQSFLERYGPGASVPLLDLLDAGSGLGPPPGYRLPPGTAAHRPQPTRADAHARLVARLAAVGSRTGASEVELSDQLLDACGVPDAGPTPRPGDSVELFACLVADSWDAIEAGAYRLVLPVHAGTGRAAKSLGRFGHALPLARPGPDAPTRTAAAAAGEQPGSALPLQLTHAVMADRMANVTRTPLVAPHHAAIGCYPHPGPAAGREPGAALRADDLEVSADARHFRLFSRSLGRDVDPFVLHLLDPRSGLANPARFLLEALAHGHPQWAPWDWGALERAPYLPALRRGRVVLSPQRWRLTDQDLPAATPFQVALKDWQHQWHVPDHVQVGTGDQRLSLNLGAAGHTDLLREELRRTPAGLDVLANPYGAEPDAGWLRGPDGPYEAELVVSLSAAPAPGTAAAEAPAAMARRPAPARRRPAPAHLPGGPWLYARLACLPEEQDELLTGPLSALMGQWQPLGVNWFFIRYPDPWPHLRLRYKAAPETLRNTVLPALHDLAADRARAGQSAELELATYRPETERYGGASALPTAEAVFARDTSVALDALRRTAPAERLPTAAIGLVRMARAFHNEAEPQWAGWLAAFRHAPPPDRATAARRHHLTRAALPLALKSADDAGPDDAWRRALAAYGDHLRSRPLPDAAVPPAHCLESLMHMHCNRVLGVDPEAEREAHALAGDLARAHLGARRARP